MAPAGLDVNGLMRWDWSWAGGAMLASGMVSGASALYLWRRPGAVGRTGLVAVLVAAAVWGVAYAVELAAGSHEARELWGTAKYLGICALPVAWLVFALQYTGRERSISARLLLAAAAVPTLVFALLSLPATRGVVRSYPRGPLERFPVVELGPVFWLFLLYSAALVTVATGLLAVTLTRAARAYRRESWVLIAAIALVWVANLLTNLGVGVFSRIDPTPVALAVAGLLLIGGVFRFGLLELVPVARTQLIETMSDAVLVLDAHRRIVDLNPAAVRVIRRSAREAIGRRVEELLGDVLPSQAGDQDGRQDLQLHHGGTTREYELALSALSDRRDAPAGQLLVLRDITERKAVERRLEQLAHFDSVTGMPNRQLFTDRLRQALARSARGGTPLAVLFVDLDRFKVINDSLGHDLGDRVLIQVAKRVSAALRAQDTLARFGGDEFCVILPELAHPEDVAVVATKILRAVARPMRLDDSDLHVTASIGIAVTPQDARDTTSLLIRADAAMYVAKAKGGDAMAFSSRELATTTSVRLELEHELRRALDRQELFLEYQPLIRLDSGAVAGAEALVRWAHPHRGTVAPDAFIPLAEEIGLMVAIDRWVLAEACRQSREWTEAARAPRPVAVNVSPALLNDDAFHDEVMRALQSSRLPPDCLTLELNERAVFSDADLLIVEKLRRLKDIGVSLSLDDFGAGRTSLAQFRQLPIDQLKIDRSFIDRLETDTADAVIVAAIVGLAHTLGLSVVAEGIEHPRQRTTLRELGCDIGQGYLFSKPRRLAKLEQQLGLPDQ